MPSPFPKHDQQNPNFAPNSESALAPNFAPSFASEFLRNGCFFAIGPSDLLIGWGEWRTAPQPGTSPCAIFSPGFYFNQQSDPRSDQHDRAVDQNAWRMPAHFEVITRELFTISVLSKLRAEVNSQIPELTFGKEDFGQRFQWVEPRLEVFEQQVRVIRERFSEGRLEKAVPVVHSQAREIMTQDRLVAILEQMNAAPTNLIPQGFWDAHSGEGLLGATPERLFSIEKSTEKYRDGSRLVTMALAGTRAKSAEGNDATKLLNDPKERHEHQLVIDDLRERLSRYGIVEVGETKVADLPTLYHLKTALTVTGSEMDFDSVARDLHPTPALGISPRSFGLENMKQWDDLKLRGRYGAPFGLRLRTEKLDIQDCLVAIRNVQWTKSHAPTLGSGCGFVKESVVDREWAELQLKRDSVKKVLNV